MAQNKFSEEERICFYNAIAALDKNKEFIKIDKEKDILSYTGKITTHEKISGRPTDEELTRSLIVLHLIKTYGYSHKKIQLETRFNIGGRRKDAARAVENDICIFSSDNKIEQICEVKKIFDYEGTEDKLIKRQLFTPFEEITKYNDAKYLFYLSVDIPQNNTHFPLQCIGIDTSINSSYKIWNDKGKIPNFYDLINSNEKYVFQQLLFKSFEDNNKNDLNFQFSISELKSKWRLLHDYIWGGKLEDNKKFENFNKILMAKIYDERKTMVGGVYQFQIKNRANETQTKEDLANDINLLYKKAFREYISTNKKIELFNIKGIDFKEFSPSLIKKCVEILQPISFSKNQHKNIDILGEFYEEVIRTSFKQTKGLFLTHPNIVIFLISALDVKNILIDKLRNPDVDYRYRLPFVIDPSCGTGTFLINYINYVQNFLSNNVDKIAKGDDDIKDYLDRFVLGKSAFKWAVDYIYGIDDEQVLATACQLNLILHGDGSTNIYNFDGLADFKDYAKINSPRNILKSTTNSDDQNIYQKDQNQQFDIIISNPPFNVKVNKDDLEKRFDVSGKSEIYFLERYYQLLREKGRMGIVMPESFFSVGDDIIGRIFLYKHFNIKVIVALPNHVFSPHTTTSTSLLIAEKKTYDEEIKFKNLWEKFSENYNQNIFEIEKIYSSKKNLKEIFENLKIFCNKSFGQSFITFPHFDDIYLNNSKNLGKLRNISLKIIKDIKDRWILNKISTDHEISFYNFSVDQVGYKSGKKGTKDKPNELISVLNGTSKIYNIKYANSWTNINEKDKNTVLGKILDLKIWQ